MKNTNQVQTILVREFHIRHVDALLKHFSTAVEKYAVREWDGVALNSGKFVEAVTKALMVHCGKTVGITRHFKAGNELRQLENLSAANFSDIVRIVIPKACLFVYEIVNNRGGRHDPHEIDANEMDAKVVTPVISWMLAEMVRFCSKNTDTDAAMTIIEELTNKKYPYFEQMEGRSYVNIDGLAPGQTALLLLYAAYPKKLNRQKLIDLVTRHGSTKNAANTAIHRLKNLVDDDAGEWKLRSLGRQKAEELLKEVLSRS